MRNRAPRVGILLLFLAVLVTGFSLPSAAWEEDLHYGLTRWLAIKAGFSPTDAESIAADDQLMDDSKYLNAIYASALIIAKKDAGAAEMVGLHHFPTAAGAPNPPRLRVVVPNSPQARAPVMEAIRDFNSYDPTEGLRRFGLALHTLQDSWSHQGVPDIPFSPRWEPWPDGEWGHPVARGGWRLHNADETPLFPGDAVATAHETYNVLCQFLARHPGLRTHKSVPWAVLQPNVEAFARAATKQEKLDWFKGDPQVPLSDYQKCDFLNHIDIPDGTRWVPQCAARSLFFAQANLPLPAGRDLHNVEETFLLQWIVRQEIGKAMELVDTKAVQTEFTTRDTKPVNGVEWTRRFLVLWLVRDHGLMNSLGHGMPKAKGYEKLPMEIESKGPFQTVKYQSLEQAIIAPSEQGLFSTLSMAPKDKQQRSAVFFSFRRLPHDGLLLVFGREKVGWRVLRMYWLTD